MKPQAKRADTGAVISAILTHLHSLLRKEVALLKSEMSDRINHAALAVGMMGLALVLVMIGLHVLATAAIAALVMVGLTPAWAAAVVAAVCLLAAVGFGWKALNMLKSASLVPHDTINTIQKDAAILKETYND